MATVDNCPSCGAEIKYCSACGTLLSDHPADHAPTPPQPVLSPTDLYDIVLHDARRAKIRVIKAVHDMTGFGLETAKELVDASDHQPTVVMKCVNGIQAQASVDQLTQAGGSASAEPHVPTW